MTINIEFMKETFLIALRGIPTTLKLTFISMLIASPFAFYMAIVKLSKARFLQKLITLYVSIIRGTPMVLQILILYSLLPTLLNLLIKKLNLNINIFDVNPIIYAYTVFTLNTIAVLSEVFRSALSTVNKGQLEAAYCAGLSSFRAYTRIIIPQALVVALPNICNVTVNLLKGTSLAFLMTVKDITALAKLEAAYGYNYIEAYIVVFLIYILICSIIQLVFKIAEKQVGAYRYLTSG